MIDSHCHLAGEEFGADLDGVVSRARDAGVTGALCILAAGDDAESRRAIAVRDAWPEIRFAAGIHPHQAAQFAGRVEHGLETLRRAVEEHRARAIGEIGLDYHYDFSPREIQQEVFRSQIRLARALDLPVVIHTREAERDTFRILREEAEEIGPGRLRGVFHCFTGDEAMARAALEIGFYLSFAGIVTFPRAEPIRAAARIAPADRILAETDSPYLAPVPHRGTRNEPAYVVHVVETLAQIRRESAGEISSQISRNFDGLFGTGSHPV